MNINIEYFKHVLEVREREIREDKSWTPNTQVYCVVEVLEHIADGHQTHTVLGSSSVRKGNRLGYLLGDESKFHHLLDPILDAHNVTCLPKATQFFSDKLVGVFLTYESAIKYAKEHEHELYFVIKIPNINDQFKMIFS